MKFHILAALLVAGVLATASVSSAFAQADSELGRYAINMPPGAYDQNAPIFYDPQAPAIPVGTTVVWFNSDPNQIHTVTSGTPEANPGSLFDSGFMNAGDFFQHTFNDAGTFDYFCMVHPWMVGKVIVGDSFEQGHNFKLSSGTGPVFDFTKNERNLLKFELTSVEVADDQPVTYKITILKDGTEAFSGDFPVLGKDLYLELIPTDTDTKVYGPDISDPVVGAFHIEGKFLKENAAYTIGAEITKLSDKTPDEPITDGFGLKIVPEFPVGVVLPLLAGIGAMIAIGRRKFF